MTMLSTPEKGESRIANDLPPPYSPAPNSPSTGNTTSPTQSTSGSGAPLGSSPPGNATTVNHLWVNRVNDSIEGSYVIDTRIRSSNSMLPLSGEGATEENRRNLVLQTRNGFINAGVWVIAGDGAFKGKVRVDVESMNGPITLRLHTDVTHTARPPCLLRIHATNGPVTVKLSHNFQGQLTLRTRNGSATLSGPLKAKTTTFSGSGTLHGFVGDSSWADGPGTWEGDEIEVETKNSAIKLQYL